MVRSRIVCILFLFFAGSPTVWASPDIKSWSLDNGARVLFVESHDLPMVQLSLVFDAGSARDPKGKAGLATLTAGMLEEGTVLRDADTIARDFESQGAEFGASASRDMLTLSLRSLSDKQYLQPALDVFRDVAINPVFPEKSFQRERGRMLIGLRRAHESPGTVAEEAFFKKLFKDHPYANPPTGTEASVSTLQRQELEDFHKQYFVGANALVTIVGDLSKREAKKLVKDLIADLPKGKVAPALAETPATVQGSVTHQDFTSSQSHIYAGVRGIYRGDPDYFPLYVGNYILGGGGLVSRLAQEIREKQGLSYSAYSYFYPMKRHGPFILGLQTRNDQRDKALALLRKTLKDFVDKGPTAKELDAAKKNLTGGFALRIDSNRKIAGYLNVIGFYGLPLTYLNDFIGRIKAVTLKQIHDAFKRRIDPDKLVVVSVGGES